MAQSDDMADKGMKDAEGTRGANVKVEVDLGGIFGGLFSALGGLADLAQKAAEQHQEVRESVFTKGPAGAGGREEGFKAVYGFTVKTAGSAAEGRQSVVVETFGNVKKTPQGPVVQEVREPVTDVFSEDKEIVQVVAEMPGAEEKEIKWQVNGDVLRLETTGGRRYEKELLLPCAVTAEGAVAAFRNGVFELRLRKVV